MNRTIILVQLFTVIFSSSLMGQRWNLVINGGFEEREEGMPPCPDAYEMLDREFSKSWQGTDSELLIKDCPEFGWDANIGSAPYHSKNFCELNGSSFPENNVYAGFYYKSGERSEYIGGDLKSTLIPEVSYTVTADVALSKAYPNRIPENPYKGVSKNFEWQFIGQKYEVHGASLYIEGKGNIETAELNGNWVHTYKIPRSTVPENYFAFDYFQLKETPSMPETPYLNVPFGPLSTTPPLSHPKGTTGKVHQAIGMPDGSKPEMHYYTWYTMTKKLKAGSFPTNKKHFVMGMFYEPTSGNFTTNSAASAPICRGGEDYEVVCGDQYSAYPPFCLEPGGQPICIDGTIAWCQYNGSEEPPYGDGRDPANKPLCPYNSGYSYYFVDNVSLTCDPEIEMQINFKKPGQNWQQSWESAMKYNSRKVEQITCGTDIKLRGSQNNIPKTEGHRWSIYAHQAEKEGSRDNTNKCNPINQTDRRIYEVDNAPWFKALKPEPSNASNGQPVFDDEFLLGDLLKLPFRRGPEYHSSPELINPDGTNGNNNYIVLKDKELVTIINEGSCHRKNNSTDPESNSPFVGKHYTLEVTPANVEIKVRHTNPETNPRPNAMINITDGKSKEKPINLSCGDDVEVSGTMNEENGNKVKWYFHATNPNAYQSTILHEPLFSRDDPFQPISRLMNNAEIIRSTEGSSEVDIEVGLAGSCETGPIRTIRAGIDKRYLSLKLPEPVLDDGFEVYCKDLVEEQIFAQSLLNPDHRNMEWRVSIKKSTPTNNDSGTVKATTKVFNPTDETGSTQAANLQELLVATELDQQILEDGDIIEVEFGDQCTGPIKSNYQYKKSKFKILSKKLDMTVNNQISKKCVTNVDPNTIDLYKPALFTVKGIPEGSIIDWEVYDMNDPSGIPQLLTTWRHGQYSHFFRIAPNQNSKNSLQVYLDTSYLFSSFSNKLNVKDRSKIMIKAKVRQNRTQCGSVATTEVDVKMIAQPVPVDIPNAFSPDGNGINDKPSLHLRPAIDSEGNPIDVKGLPGIGKGKVQIFARWGDLQYEQEIESMNFGQTRYLDWNIYPNQLETTAGTGVYVLVFEYEFGQCGILRQATDLFLKKDKF